ncbi:IucA/IucC family protein [Streptomyces sp. NPDC004609]|uniref:IucA/IucC family protein n=1 Tax=Streptomyces sp. NPDC004609 TaxID=3364704 RepID=UPI003677CEB1
MTAASAAHTGSAAHAASAAHAESTARAEPTAHTEPPEPAESAEPPLLLDVLSTLLREDTVGLRTRSTPLDLPDGTWLRRATRGGDALLLPVRTAEPGFQCETEARLPLLRRESDGTELTTCDAVLTALADLTDHPGDRDGFDAFAAECRRTLAARRLHSTTCEEITGRLTTRYGRRPADWTGPAAGLAFDTLAARLDHPVYPTGRGRPGFTDADLRAYAPEFHPRFRLRWLALPRDAVTMSGTGPAGPPSPAAGPPAIADPGPGRALGAGPEAPSALGLPAELDASHLLLPVHPLTAAGPLRRALDAAGLTGRALLADRPYLEVVPTLSTRTVALAGDPGVHLKLPLATATLGRLNRRTIKPGSLTDGAAGQRLVEAVIAREPRFRGTVLHTDETRFAHAGHELLAALVRRCPPGLDDTAVVPMAALLSPAPGGGLIADALADRHFGGDPLALLDAVLTLLFDWGTTLLRYGVALESHQQNISLLLDERHGLRLLLKDNDGPRVHAARFRDALGTDPPAFADRRIVTGDDGPVLDLFTTITVHLCAGAYAFGLARHGRAPLDRLLTLVRDRLGEAAERLGTGPGEPGALLRTHVLDAARLPVKAMVTAGTLLAKERSGALDINKHYTTGPNYLLRGSDPR